MSKRVYQGGNAGTAGRRVVRGSINVAAVIRASWRRSHPGLVHRWERIEEREAVRYWHAAQTPAEREVVERLYRAALRRFRERVASARGDAEAWALPGIDEP